MEILDLSIEKDGVVVLIKYRVLKAQVVSVLSTRVMLHRRRVLSPSQLIPKCFNDDQYKKSVVEEAEMYEILA